MKTINNATLLSESDIEFHDTSGGLVTSAPVRLAREVEPFFKKYQEEKYGEFTFAQCPGMFDFCRMGYIIPAWNQIHIKANLAGESILVKNDRALSEPEFMKPLKFEFKFDDGLVHKEDNIDKNKCAMNVTSPWKIRTKPNISAIIMPAIYHNKYLNDLHVHTGIVDYGSGFSTINFVFTIKRKCEIVINPGEPLIQIIPFHNVPIYAEFGQETTFKNNIPNWYPLQIFSHYYRKFFWKKKKFYLKSRNSFEKIVK